MKLKYIRMGNSLVMHMYNGDTQQYEPLSVEHKTTNAVFLLYENIKGDCFYVVYAGDPAQQKDAAFLDLFVHQIQADQYGNEAAKGMKLPFIGLVPTT